MRQQLDFQVGGEGESLNSINTLLTLSNFDSKYRGAQGLDPDIIKEIEVDVWNE